jgi:hypothetical protein
MASQIVRPPSWVSHHDHDVDEGPKVDKAQEKRIAELRQSSISANSRLSLLAFLSVTRFQSHLHCLRDQL